MLWEARPAHPRQDPAVEGWLASVTPMSHARSHGYKCTFGIFIRSTVKIVQLNYVLLF